MTPNTRPTMVDGKSRQRRPSVGARKVRRRSVTTSDARAGARPSAILSPDNPVGAEASAPQAQSRVRQLNPLRGLRYLPGIDLDDLDWSPLPDATAARHAAKEGRGGPMTQAANKQACGK